MRQVTGLISTYSSDEFGICSALYELGGMVVMHDASGCNSTYTTHDEPRWYDIDSMIFISAISEMEAILGDDDKFIEDLAETAEELHPKFIALVGAPIPYMIGTDLDAISEIVSRRTGIPCFGFAANGMHHYTKGVSMALERIVREFCEDHTQDNIGRENDTSDNDKTVCTDRSPKQGELQEQNQIVVNILGATPLDFSMNGSVDSIKKWITDHGMQMGVCLSMGCSLEDIKRVGIAQINLVVSYGGLAAAKYLRERFGTPYVVGVPLGEVFAGYLAETVKQAFRFGESRIGYKLTENTYHRELIDSSAGKNDEKKTEHQTDLAIIGESVFSASLASAIEMERGIKIRVLCPVDTEKELLREGDCCTPEEDDLIKQMKKISGVIADPLYRSLIADQEFYPLPHEAFSGRIYDGEIPNLVARCLGV